MKLMEIVRAVDRMSPADFREKIIDPILGDEVAISILTYGNLNHAESEDIDKFIEKINEQSFGEFIEEKDELLIFIQACSARAAAISRLN